MGLQTLEELTLEQLEDVLFNGKMKMGNHVVVPTAQKWAIIFVPLAPAVVQPRDNPDENDYAALKAQIVAIAGIQDDVQLIIDGHSRDTVPAGKEMCMHVGVNVVRRDIPE